MRPTPSRDGPVTRHRREEREEKRKDVGREEEWEEEEWEEEEGEEEEGEEEGGGGGVWVIVCLQGTIQDAINRKTLMASPSNTLEKDIRVLFASYSIKKQVLKVKSVVLTIRNNFF